MKKRKRKAQDTSRADHTDSGVAAKLRAMADAGLITLPSRKGPLPRFEPVPIKGKPISHAGLRAGAREDHGVLCTWIAQQSRTPRSQPYGER
jgi:hypothetical protein